MKWFLYVFFSFAISLLWVVTPISAGAVSAINTPLPTLTQISTPVSVGSILTPISDDCPEDGVYGDGMVTPSVAWMSVCGRCLNTPTPAPTSLPATGTPSPAPTVTGTPPTPTMTVTPSATPIPVCSQNWISYNGRDTTYEAYQSPNVNTADCFIVANTGGCIGTFSQTTTHAFAFDAVYQDFFFEFSAPVSHVYFHFSAVGSKESNEFFPGTDLNLGVFLTPPSGSLDCSPSWGGVYNPADGHFIDADCVVVGGGNIPAGEYYVRIRNNAYNAQYDYEFRLGFSLDCMDVPPPIVPDGSTYCGSIVADGDDGFIDTFGLNFGDIISQQCYNFPGVSFHDFLADAVAPFDWVTPITWLVDLVPESAVIEPVMICFIARDYSLYLFGYRVPLPEFVLLGIFVSGLSLWFGAFSGISSWYLRGWR